MEVDSRGAGCDAMTDLMLHLDKTNLLPVYTGFCKQKKLWRLSLLSVCTLVELDLSTYWVCVDFCTHCTDLWWSRMGHCSSSCERRSCTLWCTGVPVHLWQSKQHSEVINKIDKVQDEICHQGSQLLPRTLTIVLLQPPHYKKKMEQEAAPGQYGQYKKCFQFTLGLCE